MKHSRQFLEAQPRRDRNAGAERQRLAGAERRQEAEQAVAGIGHRGVHDALVVLVRHPHREHGRALRDQRRIELRRALRDEAEEHAVLAAFLGDARHRLARRAEADRAVGIGVVVRLLADDQQRQRAVAPQPELEGEAEQHRDDGVEHLGREAGELHDGHRLAVALQPQQLAQDVDHGVAADGVVVEDEGVARVLAHRLDARDQPAVLAGDRAVLELAHARFGDRDQLVHAVGHRRVDGVAAAFGADAAVAAAGFAAALLARIRSWRAGSAPPAGRPRPRRRVRRPNTISCISSKLNSQ